MYLLQLGGAVRRRPQVVHLHQAAPAAARPQVHSQLLFRLPHQRLDECGIAPEHENIKGSVYCNSTSAQKYNHRRAVMESTSGCGQVCSQLLLCLAHQCLAQRAASRLHMGKCSSEALFCINLFPEFHLRTKQFLL